MIHANYKETHSDHREDDTDDTENSLGWHDAREFLRKVQGLNGDIQRGEDVVLTFLSLSLAIHGFEISVV